MKIRAYYFLLLSLVLLGGCRDLFKQAEWDIGLLAPLASSSLSITDLVQDETLIAPDSNQNLRILFEDTIFTLEIDTLFGIPDTNISETYPIPGIQIFPGIPYVDIIKDTRYKLQTVKLNAARIRSGTVRIQFTNTLSAKLQFEYTILSATRGTDTLKFSALLDPGETVDTELDMAGYSIDFRGSDAIPDYNTITTRTLALIPLGEDTIMGPFAALQLNSDFIDLIPEYATGFFGEQLFEIEENALEIDWFKNLPSGEIDLKAIRLGLGIRNGVGTEFEVDFDYFTAINTTTDERTNLEHPIITGGEQVFIDRAGDIPGLNPVIFPARWETYFDENNSNLDAFFETLPDILRYRINLHVNPLGNTSLGQDFVYDQAGIEVYLDAEIPLELSTNQLLLIDTTDFSFEQEDNSELDDIQDGVLRLYVDNYFPFEAQIQLVLMDSNFTILDSLVQPGSRIEAAVIDNTGTVTVPKNSFIELPINPDKIELLKQGAKLEIRSFFTTRPTDELVKIKSQYRMDLKLIADLNYRIN